MSGNLEHHGFPIEEELEVERLGPLAEKRGNWDSRLACQSRKISDALVEDFEVKGSLFSALLAFA